MTLVRDAAFSLGTSQACDALEVSRASFYRWCRGPGPKKVRRSHRRLSDAERQEVLGVLTSERFVDKSVPQVWATLLDEGVYLCSIRSMYRILKENRAVRERRDQRRHPEYKKPELLATGPNQLWSWDITKLKGPGKWEYFHLYVILDVYSRCVVGWTVAYGESAHLANRLIAESCRKQGIKRDQLTLHADRGTSMRSKAVAQLLVDLSVAKSHSRPRVSNDNPYSEAQFKTLKYHPTFPKRFGCIQDARNYLRGFFAWYNGEHHHSGIGLMTPNQVHTGEASEIYRKRDATLRMAQKNHPERFVNGEPKPPALPTEVWINKPEETEEIAA
jgi:putative transposase